MLKPKLASVPLAVGLDWASNFGCLLQEKSDGRHGFKTLKSGAFQDVKNEGPFQDVFNAEAMRDGSLVLNDVLTLHGQDMTRLSTRERWPALVDWFQDVKFLGVRLCRTGSGGEFLEYLLREGGEGVVAKPWAAPFGVSWTKCKRCETFDLLVTDMDEASGSIRLADLASGEDRGWCPCKASFQAVKIGDVAEVLAYSLTAKGKLREPRFVRLRRDKDVSGR